MAEFWKTACKLWTTGNDQIGIISFWIPIATSGTTYQGTIGLQPIDYLILILDGKQIKNWKLHLKWVFLKIEFF